MTNGKTGGEGEGFAERVGRAVREVRDDIADTLDENDSESALAREINREKLLDETATTGSAYAASQAAGVTDGEADEIIVEPTPFDAEADEAQAEEQLLLADEEERLPWLESDDDYEEGGFDMARLVMIALLAVVSLLVIFGLIWMASQPSQDEELLAEGSTIEASDEPFRTAPDNPGGTEVAGTGDMSFEVSEGQSRDSQLAESDGSAAPSIDRAQDSASGASDGSANAAGTGSDRASGSDSAAGEVSSSSGVAVQVAAYSSRARAQQGWNDLSRRYDALQGLNYRIEEATVDGAQVYRLQAVASSSSAADSVCRSLRAAGGDCQVKR